MWKRAAGKSSASLPRKTDEDELAGRGYQLGECDECYARVNLWGLEVRELRIEVRLKTVVELSKNVRSFKIA